MDEKKLLDDKELEQVSGGRVDRDMYPHLVVTTTATKIYRVLPTPTSGGEALINLSANVRLLTSDEVVHCIFPYQKEYDFVKCAVRLTDFDYGYVNINDIRDTGITVNK